MQSLEAFNFRQWIDANRVHLKRRWATSACFKMAISSSWWWAARTPARTTTSTRAGILYQLEGGIVLKTMQDGRAVDVPIRAGEVLLIPPNMPHSPQRPANTVGLVIERTAARASSTASSGTASTAVSACTRSSSRSPISKSSFRRIRALLHEHRQAYLRALRQGHGALVNARIAVGGRELISMCRAR